MITPFACPGDISPVPSRPHMTPTIGRDVRKRQVDSFSCPPASLPVSPRPARPSVGRREDGGKAAPYQRRVALRSRSWDRIIYLRQTYHFGQARIILS